MASDLKQLLSKACELLPRGEITSEDSAAALRRSREILSILFRGDSERKFNTEPDSK